MTWNFWCFITVVNLFFIFTEVKSIRQSLIIENLIPEKINPNLLKIVIKKSDGTVLYQLEFKKTKGILANSKTPILKYLDDSTNKDMSIRFYPDYEVMQEIGNFSFYHDIDNKASAVLFSDNDGYYLDGIIKDEFRLNRFPVNYLDNVLKRPQRHIIQESSSNIERLNENTLSELNNAVQSVNTFYPELLVVLDYNLLINVPKTQAIKTQLVYWNAVDMLFASMKSPEIHLNIAAYILPTSQYAFPFLENEPGTDFVDFYDAIEGIETLFYKYRDQISVDYDIIVAMTGAKLCVKPNKANPVMNCINGISEGRPDTVNKFDDEREAVDSSAILHFDHQVSSFTNAAQKIAYMFTGEFTQKREKKKCPGIMEEYYRRGKFSLSWSTCTQRKVADYLQLPKAAGLKNFPKYLLTEKKTELLPTEPPTPSGGWLGKLNNWLFSKNKDENSKIITTEPSLYETTNLIITTEASLPEITEQVFELTDKASEIIEQVSEITNELTEKIPEITEQILEVDDSNINLQQQITTSEASSLETAEKILELLDKASELIEKIPEINDSNVDVQQEFTNSKAFVDNVSTNPTPSIYSTIKPLSSDYLEIVEDNISTTSSSNENSPVESSSENYPIDEISVVSNPSEYFTSKPLSESFLDEDKKNVSLKFESLIQEEKISTLKPAHNSTEVKSEDLPSTTVKSLIEKHQKRQDNYIFVDVTIPSKESDSVVNDHTNISKSSLAESKVSLELNQQNLTNSSVVDPAVEEQVDRKKGQYPWVDVARRYFDPIQVNEAIDRYRATSESSKDSYDPYDYEQSDQAVLPNKQEEIETSDKVPPTLKPDKKLSEPKESSSGNLINNETPNDSALDINTFNKNEATSSTELSTQSPLESTSSSPARSSCKTDNMNLDVTLQLNINTNDKNIKTLKKSFHGNSLNQENDNTTDTNDNNRVIKSIIDYLLEHSDR